MKRLLVAALLATALIATVLPLDRQMRNRPVAVKLGFIPGPTVLKLISADQRPLVAEVAVLKVLFYYGSLVEQWKNRVPLAPEYANMFRTIETAVRLDPYNMDAYYFAQAAFTWEVGHAADVNRLLAYGMKYRTWDWYLPFFAGFNAAYFLHDYAQAASYMQKAAELSGNQLLTTLTSRYFYKAGREALGIAFLQTMIKQTSDAQEREVYQMRLTALQEASRLQGAVKRYRQEEGHLPANLQDLLRSGYVDQIPRDPYGGKFYLDDQGRVRSTSKFAEQSHK